MPSENELLSKCLDCAKMNTSGSHPDCRFCRNLEFQESDGDPSVEEMARRMKIFTNNAIVGKLPMLKDMLDGNTVIWDEAYFVETVG